MSPRVKELVKKWREKSEWARSSAIRVLRDATWEPEDSLDLAADLLAALAEEDADE